MVTAGAVLLIVIGLGSAFLGVVVGRMICRSDERYRMKDFDDEV